MGRADVVAELVERRRVDCGMGTDKNGMSLEKWERTRPRRPEERAMQATGCAGEDITPSAKEYSVGNSSAIRRF